ncbi:TPA: hypothetical protein ACTW08_003271 [Raoultella planticola]
MNNENELTAALATIEKCREVSGCPASVDLQDHVRQLAAENVGMKGVLTGNAYINFIKANGWNASASTVNGKFVNFADPEVDFSAMVFTHAKKLVDDIKTPATDRIYAGIKAYGGEWIEGSEPREFGRYWVRYETDIGPQYCSAQWMEYNFCASSDTNIHKIWLADHSRSINNLKGVTHYTKLPAALEGGAL